MQSCLNPGIFNTLPVEKQKNYGKKIKGGGMRIKESQCRLLKPSFEDDSQSKSMTMVIFTIRMIIKHGM